MYISKCLRLPRTAEREWLRNDRRNWQSSRSVRGLVVREPRRPAETHALCARPSPMTATGTQFKVEYKYSLDINEN